MVATPPLLTKRALLIGNCKYEDGKKLKYCINNVQDVGNELHKIGFRVTVGTDLTYMMMADMILSFEQEINEGDLVVFFFSGHKTQWEDQNYLIAVDNIGLTDKPALHRDRAVRAQSILESMMNYRPYATVFILDCCRTYAMKNRTLLPKSRTSIDLTPIRPTIGSLVTVSCSPNKDIFATSNNGRNSIFTYHLLKHIAEPNLKIDEMMSRTCDGVYEDTNGQYFSYRLSTLHPSNTYFNFIEQNSSSDSSLFFRHAMPNLVTNTSVHNNGTRLTSRAHPTVDTAGTGLISLQSMTPSISNRKDEMRGWLYKWTNHLKGYRKRWFVLQFGILSYYQSQNERMHTCRRTIYLESAHFSSNDARHFVISDGSTIIRVHTTTETDKQRWLAALELAKEKALKNRNQYQDSEKIVPDQNNLLEHQGNSLLLDKTSDAQGLDLISKSSDTVEGAEMTTMNKTLETKLENLKMCADLMNYQHQTLCRTLEDLEQMDNKFDSTVNTIQSVNERASLFHNTSTVMLNTCQEFIHLIQNQGVKWQQALQLERDARLRMEHMYEQVVVQSAKLEKQT